MVEEEEEEYDYCRGRKEDIAGTALILERERRISSSLKDDTNMHRYRSSIESIDDKTTKRTTAYNTITKSYGPLKVTGIARKRIEIKNKAANDAHKRMKRI